MQSACLANLSDSEGGLFVALLLTDHLGKEHRIETVEDPTLIAVMNWYESRINEVVAENQKILAWTKRKLRGMLLREKEFAEVQQLVDASISNLDPGRG